jgi:hypothetical protein
MFKMVQIPSLTIFNLNQGDCTTFHGGILFISYFDIYPNGSIVLNIKM